MAEIPKAYDPSQVENQWYERWSDAKAFQGRPDDASDAYSIVIPPPNVTGVLTMGHVLNNTIQDILTRRARLQGKAAMWLPGTDHAGIATQTRVERKLREEEGKTRHDLGRDEFVKRVWEWRDTHGGIILKQLRHLGASCDWDRTHFTLDEHYAQAVIHAFVELYKRGYIYRGKRMVNWCPVSLTALSDEEVIMKPSKSKLYKMRYELVEHPGQYLEISTTRPETLMGDTAVAVHPEDERYKHLVGSTIWRPFPRKAIPIIGDSYVDREFGTGALKVTPAHDKNDFEIGQRHKLEVIDVFNPDGTLNALAGEEFDGMERFEAREKAAAKLQELGLLVEVEDYENSVGFSERADVPIEPRLSEQWFLKYPKVEEAKTAVREGIIKFWPERWTKTYLHWLDNIQDWCISRQLWWGHRIPVWYKKGENRTDPANWHVSIDGPEDPENWEQDEDVLDTWASSWLWPFATMGWPNCTPEQQKDLDFFYPTTDLVTGPDIIFFWVARMIMAGLEFMGEEKESLTLEEIKQRIPFHNVFFTGIIRDEQGRKMSKSLGNSPEPLDLIKEFGADGLRFGIMSIAPKGQDILFSNDRVAIGRNFCNKLWNACRFRQMSGPVADNQDLAAILARIDADQLDDYDHWILQRLLKTVSDLDTAFKTYEFNQITHVLYDFFWKDFCDTYVEVSKSKLKNPEQQGTVLAVQDFVIRQLLLMLEPVTPHIAEELWHRLGYGDGKTFVQDGSIESDTQLVQTLADAGITVSEATASQVTKLEDLITKARTLKAEFNLANKRDVNFLYQAADDAAAKLISAHQANLESLIGAESLKATAETPDLPGSITELGTVYIDLAGSVDMEAEKERLTKELDKLAKIIAGSEGKLKNEKFVNGAPAHIVEGARKQLAENHAKRDELQKLLRRFS